MNKSIISFLICFPLVLITACSSSPKIKYAEYHNDQIVQGPGGTVRTVDGIDIWTDGAPKRNFKILGIMGQSQRGGGHGRGPIGALMLDSSPSSSKIEAALIKQAKSHGGDAIVIIHQQQQTSGEDDFFKNSDDDSGGGRHGHHLQAVVIKYVP